MKKLIVLYSIVLAILLLSGCSYKPYGATVTPVKPATTTTPSQSPIQSNATQHEERQGIGIQIDQFSWYVIFMTAGYYLGKRGFVATIKDINSKIRRKK